ncbi:uncharacterized protein BYT42DRAFT_488587, partial [Radiomyces spectabilis]|uniref:uncharacterized protein n=1 Tax=Radiomyces spectabilis TaxID=64574 RepID=UPI00222079E9
MNGRQAHSQRVLRVKDPPMFTGKLEHVASFITHVKLAIAMNRDQFRDELAKICYMCSFMSDDAFDWARIYLD